MPVPPAPEKRKNTRRMVNTPKRNVTLQLRRIRKNCTQRSPRIPGSSARAQSTARRLYTRTAGGGGESNGKKRKKEEEEADGGTRGSDGLSVSVPANRMK
jgi:hypothetical protein